MGFLGKLFGKKGGAATASRGTYKTCEGCGKPIEVGGQMMSIMTDDIDRWSIGGLAGYCRSCARYLCSDHLEFRNTTGQPFGPWEVSCRQCGVSVATGP